MKRKSSTENSVIFLGKKKVQVTFKTFIFVVGSPSAANWVGTTLEFAVFRSGPDLKHSRAGAFRFFLSTNMVFVGGPNRFSQAKHPCLS